MSLKIREIFSSIAPRYDRLNTILSFGIDRLWRRRGVSYLLTQKNVLDLCAGTLPLTKELLTQNPHVLITAVDFSQKMLEIGERSIPSQMARRVTIECVDFYKFTRQPSTFDGAMCAYGMRNLDNNEEALQRIHRFLKIGGRLVILDFFRPDRWYSRLFHLTYAQFVIPLIGWLISGQRNAYRHLRDSIRGFYTLDEYRRLLQETGFKVTVAERLTGGISGLVVAEKQ